MRPRRPSLAAVSAALALLAGCGREPSPALPARPLALPVNVLADSGASFRVPLGAPPEARVWVARVSPARPVRAAPPPPAPAPDSEALVEPPDAPAAAIDPGLRPPLLRQAAPLTVPPGAGTASVELEVNVDETGAVVEVEWAGGARDTALVGAATRCAHAMRFYPAERGGRAVAVWCRQRFDFGAARGAAR